MARKKNKHRIQRSKAARDALKEARFAGLSRRIGHRSHFNSPKHWGRWWWVRSEKIQKRWKQMETRN